MQSNVGELNKYTPAYVPLSTRAPTEGEKRIDATLKKYMDVEMKLESDEEMVRRDSILAEVRTIFLNWVQHVAVEVLHLPGEEAEDAGGELFISGSHRLGVRDVGADIDTVCVAPNFCTREHFFTYLKEDLQQRSEVTNMIAIEEAFVPIISFDFRDVNIDLLFARLADNSVAKNIDILDDRILIGLDEATEKSLNGPRVTNMIFKLVGEKTFPNFLIVLRCIRKWAKRRGLYGNKLGYLGGINCNILVAFICQLYPNYSPSALLFRFFKHYSNWNWPDPIMLNNIQQTAPGTMLSDERAVWSPAANAKDLMPIITPAYPAMNSSFNVSTHTLEVMKQEFRRGYEVTEMILKEKGDKRSWHRLFEPSDFFIKYGHYLACHIVGTGDNPESRGWTGFVESRIRRLTQYPYLEALPLRTPIQLYPIVSKTSKSSFSTCYFIGFNLNHERIQEIGDKNIHIDECVALFQDALLDPERGYKGKRVEGLDFFVDHMTWKRLPKEVFEPLGGFAEAKQMRTDLGYAASAKASGPAAAAAAATTGEGEGGGEGGGGGMEEGKEGRPSDTQKGTAEGAGGTIEAKDGATVEVKQESSGKDEAEAAASKLTTAAAQQPLKYALGERWFKASTYGGFGAAGVDTIEKSKKRLREETLSLASSTTSQGEILGGDGHSDSLAKKLFPKEFSATGGINTTTVTTVTKLADVPVLLPPRTGRVFGNSTGSSITREGTAAASSNSTRATYSNSNATAPKRTYAIPNVTWSLLDNK